MKEQLQVPPESDGERHAREVVSALAVGRDTARGLRSAIGAVIGYWFLVVVTFGLLVDGDTLGRLIGIAFLVGSALATWRLLRWYRRRLT